MNRKIALGAFLIAIVAVALAAWLVQNQISTLHSQISELQTQNDELQDQNDELQEQNIDLQNQINKSQDQTGFLQDRLQEKLNENYEGSPVRIVEVGDMAVFAWLGQNLFAKVNVTLLNNYSFPVSGLTLTTKYNELTSSEGGVPLTIKIDELQAGESRKIEAEVRWIFSSGHNALVVTLKLGDFVMDEWIEAD
jgi:cell division protein FtsB